ncbi:24615_t:CDS:10, partial [Cetraspora pellucida]
MATSDPSSLDFGLEGFQKLIEEYKAKELQIMELTKQLEQLKKENTRLQSQIKSSPDQFINTHHFDQKKAHELKTALGNVVDEILTNNKEHTNRPMVFGQQRPSWPLGSNSNATHNEVNQLIELEENGSKSTNNNTINHVPTHTNHIPTSHEPIIDSHPQFNHAQVRPSDDNKLIGEATLSHQHQFPVIPDGKVDPYNPHNPRRFVSNSHFNNPSNPNSISLNNNPNKNNKKIKPDKPVSNLPKYTVFIAWTGSMSAEGLKALFENDEVRFLPNKQFAHVDLKTEAAKNKALKLNGEVKSQEQGRLRVEEGKPRGNNST